VTELSPTAPYVFETVNGQAKSCIERCGSELGMGPKRKAGS
jgi:hypothetical protein